MENIKRNEKVFCCYRWDNLETGELYVGSGALSERFWKHTYSLKNNTHWNRKFKKAYNNNNNFKFSYVVANDREHAYDLEQTLIDKEWGKPTLLNLSKNVRGGQHEVFEETRLKMRLAKLGKKRSEETKLKIGLGARGNTNTRGSKLTPEHIAKVVLRTKGLKRTPEQISNLKLGSTNRNLGFKHSDETRKKRSEYLKTNGIKPSEKCIKASNAVWLGKKHTPETIELLKKQPHARPIVVDNIIYPSVRQASRELNINKQTLAYRLTTETKNCFYLTKEENMENKFIPQRKKNALDNRKLNLSTASPSAPGKKANLIWGLYEGNPRLTVYVGDNEGTKVSANLDISVFYAFIQMLEQACASKDEWKAKIVNKNFTWFGGKRSEQAEVVSELWAGRDKDGQIWISVIDTKSTKVRFFITAPEFHEFCDGTGAPMPKGDVSVLFARGYISLLKNLYSQMFIEAWPEVEIANKKRAEAAEAKRNGGGGNYGNRGGGGNNYSNNAPRPAAPAPAEAAAGTAGDDFPF